MVVFFSFLWALGSCFLHARRILESLGQCLFWAHVSLVNVPPFSVDNTMEEIFGRSQRLLRTSCELPSTIRLLLAEPTPELTQASGLRVCIDDDPTRLSCCRGDCLVYLLLFMFEWKSLEGVARLSVHRRRVQVWR